MSKKDRIYAFLGSFFIIFLMIVFNDCLNRAEWMQVIRTIQHLFHDRVQPTADAGGEELLSGFRSPRTMQWSAGSALINYLYIFG